MFCMYKPHYVSYLVHLIIVATCLTYRHTLPCYGSLSVHYIFLSILFTGLVIIKTNKVIKLFVHWISFLTRVALVHIFKKIKWRTVQSFFFEITCINYYFIIIFLWRLWWWLLNFINYCMIKMVGWGRGWLEFN